MNPHNAFISFHFMCLFHFYFQIWFNSIHQMFHLISTFSRLYFSKRNYRDLLGGIGGRRKRGRQRMDGWMASPTRWTWVWVNSRRWWWTGRPGVLRFMGSQRVGHDWATELNWTELNCGSNSLWFIYFSIQENLLSINFVKASWYGLILERNSYQDFFYGSLVDLQNYIVFRYTA